MTAASIAEMTAMPAVLRRGRGRALLWLSRSNYRVKRNG